MRPGIGMGSQSSNSAWIQPTGRCLVLVTILTTTAIFCIRHHLNMNYILNRTSDPGLLPPFLKKSYIYLLLRKYNLETYNVYHIREHPCYQWEKTNLPIRICSYLLQPRFIELGTTPIKFPTLHRHYALATDVGKDEPQ